MATKPLSYLPTICMSFYLIHDGSQECGRNSNSIDHSITPVSRSSSQNLQTMLCRDNGGNYLYRLTPFMTPHFFPMLLSWKASIHLLRALVDVINTLQMLHSSHFPCLHNSRCSCSIGPRPAQGQSLEWISLRQFVLSGRLPTGNQALGRWSPW